MISLVGKSYFLDKASPDPLMGSLLPLMSSGIYCPYHSFASFDLVFAHHLNPLMLFDFVFAGKKLKI